MIKKNKTKGYTLDKYERDFPSHDPARCCAGYMRLFIVRLLQKALGYATRVNQDLGKVIKH